MLDRQARNWAEYGPRHGARNLLRALGDFGVQAVFYVSGIVAERCPELLKEIAGAGQVVAAHAWAQDQMPAYQSNEEEQTALEHCISVLSDVTGTKPLGWMSPRCTPSEHTQQLLSSAGFCWTADIFNTDLPDVLDDQSRLIAVPFSPEVNDMPLSIRYGEPRR